MNNSYFPIAGIMLLVTGLFNFILSKKTKSKPPKRLQDGHGEQGPATVCVTEGAPSENNFSFFHLGIGRRGGGVTPTPITRLSLGERGESVEAMLKLEQTDAPKDRDSERKRWRQRRMMFFRPPEEPVEREMEEMECYSEPDTTSDTAPMITD